MSGHWWLKPIWFKVIMMTIWIAGSVIGKPMVTFAHASNSADLDTTSSTSQGNVPLYAEQINLLCQAYNSFKETLNLTLEGNTQPSGDTQVHIEEMKSIITNILEDNDSNLPVTQLGGLTTKDYLQRLYNPNGEAAGGVLSSLNSELENAESSIPPYSQTSIQIDSDQAENYLANIRDIIDKELITEGVITDVSQSPLAICPARQVGSDLSPASPTSEPSPVFIPITVTQRDSIFLGIGFVVCFVLFMVSIGAKRFLPFLSQESSSPDSKNLDVQEGVSPSAADAPSSIPEDSQYKNLENAIHELTKHLSALDSTSRHGIEQQLKGILVSTITQEISQIRQDTGQLSREIAQLRQQLETRQKPYQFPTMSDQLVTRSNYDISYHQEANHQEANRSSTTAVPGWLHSYTQSPSNLEGRATVVAETEDSRGRRRGGAPDRTVFLEENPNGAFWIICDNGNDYLVLKANVTVNQFNQDSFKACFDNLLPGQVGKQPQISRPARVQSTGGRWQLIEKGEFS